MTVILNWYGPYTAGQLYKLPQRPAIMTLSGKEPYKRKAKLYYLGLCNRPGDVTGKVSNVKRELRYWRCEVAHVPEGLGNVLEMAERSLSRAWGPVYRDEKPAVPFPAKPMTMVFQYFKTNGEPRLARPRFHGPQQPNVLHWDGSKTWWGKV